MSAASMQFNQVRNHFPFAIFRFCLLILLQIRKKGSKRNNIFLL
jgi:hypothetical protein